MKQKKSIFLLVAIFLISTTGVTVYKHHCSHGGMFYGVFVDVEHKCGPVVEEVPLAHDCCITSNSSDVQFEEDCCESDVQIYQLDIDLATNNLKIDFISNFTFSFSNSVLLSIPEFKEVSILNKAPPVLSTLERLSLFQMYLI